MFKKQNNPNNSSVYEDQKQIGFHEKQEDESSVVSISKRCEFSSDKSIITGFVKEPKAVCFIVHDYDSSVIQETKKKKMVTFYDESITSSIVLEKPFTVENNKLEKPQSQSQSESEVFFIKEHVKEDMLVYEFMSCGVLKELLVHENFVGCEENLLDDDDGFIELNPSLQISDIAYGEEEEEQDFMQREEEQLNMGFEDDDEEEDEYEHSDVIERLKTELRTARTGGLCTILEESETPLEELKPKPLKIEPKQDHHKERLAEIHKVYKNYAAKMRKLDVIDSQTMHSISKFLSFSMHKSYKFLINMEKILSILLVLAMTCFLSLKFLSNDSFCFKLWGNIVEERLFPSLMFSQLLKNVQYLLVESNLWFNRFA